MLKNKSDVHSTFINWQQLVERQYDRKVKSVQTDGGREFYTLSSHFKSVGSNHRVSCPHTSAQNGLVERKHRHVVETGLSLLAHSSVPSILWDHAFEAVVYIINRLPSRANNNMSPFHKLFINFLTIIFLRFLDVFVFLFYDHIIKINWSIVQLLAFFLVIVMFIMVTNALILVLTKFL